MTGFMALRIGAPRRCPRTYGVDKGLICGFPTICRDGKWEIVQGLELSEFQKERIAASVAELREEREAVADLL